MKRKIIIFTLIILIFILGILIGLNIYDNKDINRDGKVNAQDYVLIKKYIMERCDNNG